MKGFLLTRGVKVTDRAVRNAMRIADPDGVYYRTLTNRPIVRRQYNVSYFNQLWHLDTNMKLIRWNIIIRGCIDGKSRLVVYLHASGDKKAVTNLNSFVLATTLYGVPFRTRSDKGGENVGIAEFMLEQRGTGRASHICGKSVHNQRIERYWRDVYYGYTSDIVNTFTMLEQNGLFDIDNPKHMFMLHNVYLPRINSALEWFRNSWNHHTLSTESNKTPTQLMIMNMPPVANDLEITEAELHDTLFVCNDAEDVHMLEDETIVNPMPIIGSLSNQELARLQEIDLTRDSDNMGCDIFLEVMSCLDTVEQ